MGTEASKQNGNASGEDDDLDSNAGLTGELETRDTGGLSAVTRSREWQYINALFLAFNKIY